MTPLTLSRSILIAAPRERVWQAVTEPAELAQWLLPPALGAQLKRDDSGTLLICLGPMEVGIAVYEKVDTPRQITSRTLPDRVTTTTYTLDDDQGGTRVTVTLAGFEGLPKAPREERLGPSGAAWEKALKNLKAYVDGAPLPHPEGFVAALFGYRREALEKLAIERSIWIAAPAERVWRAITEPKEIEQWYSPGTPWRASALEVGGKLSVYNPETDTDTHTELIEVLEPAQRLVTRSVPEPPAVSQVTTWTLTPESDGTRLTVTVSGYELDTPDARHNNMEQNAFGFGMMLENLQAHLAGSSLPYPWGF